MGETAKQVQWLTIQQLAERWNVSHDTIRRRVQAGDVPLHPVIRRIPLKAVVQIEAQIGGQQKRDVRRLRRCIAGVKDHYPEC